jgi:hypothetical protein
LQWRLATKEKQLTPEEQEKQKQLDADYKAAPEEDSRSEGG